MFDTVLGCWKSKEPASIEAHQKFGAVRVGTLRDHGIERCKAGGAHQGAYSWTCGRRKESPENRELSLLSTLGPQLASPGIGGIFINA